MFVGTSQAARYLRAHGITLFGVRDETIKLLGKADMYYFSPEHPPLTEPAQKALDWAVDEKLKAGMYFVWPMSVLLIQILVSVFNQSNLLFHALRMPWILTEWGTQLA
jgi:hypothetical protein